MRRFVAVVPIALLLAVASTAGGRSSAAAINVAITRVSCSVSPRTVDAGVTTFHITNRGAQAARFSVAGKGSTVRLRRAVDLTVVVPPGRRAYACIVGKRRVGAGVLRVEARSLPSLAHRISVRPAEGTGSFYDTVSGDRFVPRGANYVRLAPQRGPWGRFIYHSTFNTDAYDPARAERALRRMAQDGFNVVRVFLNGQCSRVCLRDVATRSLSVPYLQDLVDFLWRAKANGLTVIITHDGVPTQTRYDDLLNDVPRSEVDNVNLNFLTDGGVRANAEFWRDLAALLIKWNAPTDAIFAYELQNEAFFASSALPFTRAAGTITTGNGHAYDLGLLADRQRMIDENLVNYVDRVRAAVRLVDPTALVAIGFFEPQEPNPARIGDDRLIRTEAVIERSSADFVDVHAYPGGALTLERYAQNFGIDGSETKPVIMGEFGAPKFAYSTPAAAVPALLAWQYESCRYGIDGWLLWTWDTDEQAELWSASSGGGVIEQALAPRNRPNPCS